MMERVKDKEAIWSKLGSATHQINETELSFLEPADRIGLQADAGVVFSQFLSSRETFFRFLFTVGVREIAN